MAEAKTQPTGLSVAAYLNAIEDETRRKDCKELVALMKRVTACAPKMLGTSIVGFDRYHIKRLSDVRLPILEEMVSRSVAETRRRHP